MSDVTRLVEAAAAGDPRAAADLLPLVYAELQIWDTTTGKGLRTLVGHEHRVGCVAFSPDGRHLASASQDNTVRVWEAATGKDVAVRHGHIGYVLSVAFSADGKRLASSGGYRAKGDVRIWDPSQWDKKPARK